MNIYKDDKAGIATAKEQEKLYLASVSELVKKFKAEFKMDIISVNDELAIRDQLVNFFMKRLNEDIYFSYLDTAEKNMRVKKIADGYYNENLKPLVDTINHTVGYNGFTVIDPEKTIKMYAEKKLLVETWFKLLSEGMLTNTQLQISANMMQAREKIQHLSDIIWSAHLNKIFRN